MKVVPLVERSAVKVLPVRVSRSQHGASWLLLEAGRNVTSAPVAARLTSRLPVVSPKVIALAMMALLAVEARIISAKRARACAGSGASMNAVRTPSPVRGW